MKSIVQPVRPSLLAALLVAFLFGLSSVFAPVAQAHDRLLNSTPADGETLTAQPEWLELEFSGNIQEMGSEVEVLLDGTDVSAGQITVEGKKLTSALPQDMGPGTYTVNWRVVSEDLHPIDGSFGFVIGDSSAQGDEAGHGAAEGADTPQVSLEVAAVDRSDEEPLEQGELEGSEEAASGQSPADIVLLAVGVLAVAAIVVVLLVRKQKGLGAGTQDEPQD